MGEVASIGGVYGIARVFSIGHSNLALDRFVLLLQVHNIDVLVDVRSRPYSRWASHFSLDSLKRALQGKGIEYIYLGKELGGKPDSDEFYDAHGYVVYRALAGFPRFLDGIRRLEKRVNSHRVAVMCAEEDPKSCHRRLLVGRVLAEHGVTMIHIRSDGRLQTEDELKQQESGDGVQLSIFPPQEDTDWRSVKPIRSVSPSDERRISSEP
jgi:uncharacterized protein (DUF488 family)